MGCQRNTDNPWMFMQTLAERELGSCDFTKPNSSCSTKAFFHFGDDENVPEQVCSYVLKPNPNDSGDFEAIDKQLTTILRTPKIVVEFSEDYDKLFGNFI
jgi:hypothetical protein